MACSQPRPSIVHFVYHLLGGDVAYQLRERDRITGAGETLGCHQVGRSLLDAARVASLSRWASSHALASASVIW
jgi:hypothetical protein